MQFHLKRIFDVSIVLSSLPLTLPLIGIVALLVCIRIGRPIFFFQQRPGLHGKPFELVKFRTMADARDAEGALLSDHERLDDFGRFLRGSSLDELPTLWCVLKGNMSLVGPRPLLMEYLPRYSPEQNRRHEVLPGITGWAQVNGRNAISWEEKFRLDVWYVDHQSFFLDMEILFRTLRMVLRREGISADGHSTMPVFSGKEDDRFE